MAPLVHLEITGDAGGAVGFGRDHSHSPVLSQISPDGVAVEGFIGQQGGELEPVQQRRDANAVVPLPGEETEPHQVAQRIDQGEDFGRQPAA